MLRLASCLSSFCLCLLLLNAVALPHPANAAAVDPTPVHVRIDADRAVISNGHLSVELSRNGRQAQTVLVRNLRARKELSLDGDDFTLEFEGGRVIRSGELEVETVRHVPVGTSGKRLAAEYQGEGLQVTMLTEMHADRWWATRWLEIRAPGRKLTKVNLAQWRCVGARGPAGPGQTVGALGFPSGCGQPVYAQDLFFAVAHPGAENFAQEEGISCSIPAHDELGQQTPTLTRKLVIGAGPAGDGRRAFLKYIDQTRAVPARMVFLVNDWYWKDKSQPLKALKALVGVKQQSGVPVDSFTLDDGWDFDWDKETMIWGRLHRQRFPGGWDALQAVGRPADINVSLWFGPIGGYSYRPKRIEFAQTVGFEIQDGKLCLAGPRYSKHVVDSFSHWAARGMDYIKVDGFWPNCRVPDHGHVVGPSGAIAQMDALIDVFAAWHRARPDLLIGYTSGSNPSPFWLQHVDFVWRGGRDDSHAGAGEPFDRHNTYLDSILQTHRQTDMPVSAFVTFDIVQGRIAGNRDDVFERGCWWLAARTSLHHDWYIQASDLSLERWKTLARAARWAKSHERVFRFSRMVGGDPARGELYGFSAFDEGAGTLALRNPSDEPRVLESPLTELLDLPDAARGLSFQLRGVYGKTSALEGTHRATDGLRIELPPLEIAVFEVGLDRP